MCNRCVHRTGAGKSPSTENASRVAPLRCVWSSGKHLPEPPTHRAHQITHLHILPSDSNMTGETICFKRKGGGQNAFYFYSPIKFSAATRKGALVQPTPLLLTPLFLFLTRLKASGAFFFSRPRPDVCVNLNKTVSKWATAPPACLPGRDRGSAGIRTGQGRLRSGPIISRHGH